MLSELGFSGLGGFMGFGVSCWGIDFWLGEENKRHFASPPILDASECIAAEA